MNDIELESLVLLAKRVRWEIWKVMLRLYLRCYFFFR